MKNLSRSIANGLLLIVLGLIFLLMNYDLLSWDFWRYAIDLWPLLLILGGISLFFRQQISFSVVFLVFLLLLIGYSLYAGTGPDRNFQSTASSQLFSVARYAGDQQAKVDVELGGTKLRLRGVEQATLDDQLLTGSYRWNKGSFGDEPEVRTSRAGDEVRIAIESNKIAQESELELELSDQVRYSLAIEAGAIDGDLDLRKLQVDELKLDTGASRIRLEFGDNGGTTKADISCGASDVTLVVPENVGLRVNFSGVISSSNFMGSSGVLGDKVWVSPNYAEAKTKVDVDIAAAAGSVQLERPAVSY